MTLIPVRGALTALALVMLAAPALAQTSSPDADAHHQHLHEMMERHKAAMSRDLHTILNIRPDQEAAFAAFQTSMTPPSHDSMKGDRMKDHGRMEAMTTPQRLDMMLSRMDERMAHMRRHIEATKAFYAALSPQQQQTFDALMRMHHGMHGGGHWGGHEGMMHGVPGEGPPPPGA